MKRTPKPQPPKPDIEFHKVFDDQKNRIRGLWFKKGTYYAQLDANNGRQYKYPLPDAQTIPQAITKMQVFKDVQREGKLFPPARMKPAVRASTPETNGRTITAAIVSYQKQRDGLKLFDDDTCKRQDSGLKRWLEKFGERPFEELNNKMRKDYAAWRMSEEGGGICGRTVDIDISAINNVMEHAVDDLEWLPENPFSVWKKLAGAPKEVRLLDWGEIELICTEAVYPDEDLKLFKADYRNWLQKTNRCFADYFKLLCLAGGREQETAKQKWSHVDWKRRRLKFPGSRRSDENRNLGAKAGGGIPAPDRWVDFHEDLEKHLRDMESRRDPKCDWIFPNEERAGPIGTFRNKLERLKKRIAKNCPELADIKEVTFHWTRHYFISMAMMSQPYIDVATIARWVGHRDKGVLILQKYGHLRDDHTAAMAKHLSHTFSKFSLRAEAQTEVAEVA